MNLAEVRARDGDRCAKCSSTRDLHVHHRVLRGQGGRDDPENVITLCASCHRWCHHNPYAARELGLLLRHTEDPATIPVRHVLWPAGPVLLGPDLTFILWAEDIEERRLSMDVRGLIGLAVLALIIIVILVLLGVI